MIQYGPLHYQGMEDFNIEGDDNMTDSSMEHNPFANGMPNIDSFDEIEDCDEICMCTDCEGTWIEDQIY